MLKEQNKGIAPLSFSAPNQDKCLKDLVKIPLTNEHLFYYYFVPLPVENSLATKGFTRPCVIYACLHTVLVFYSLLLRVFVFMFSTF